MDDKTMEMMFEPCFVEPANAHKTYKDRPLVLILDNFHAHTTLNFLSRQKNATSWCSGCRRTARISCSHWMSQLWAR